MGQILKTVNSNVKVDMHIHTAASDGTWHPDRLVTELIGKEINVFSVTDHDSVENTIRVKKLADDAGLLFIPGVEVTASFNNCTYHILGYGIDINNKPLHSLLESNTALMEEKDEESIKYLEKRDYKVSLSEYHAYENLRERGGWKALNYLLDKGLCSNFKDFFALFTGWGNPFNKMTFHSPEEVAKTILVAGGIPVLAHPQAPFYEGEYKSTIAFMLEQGVKGLECFHPENSPECTDYCLQICRDKNLLITGGSDCHGEFASKRFLGFPEIHIRDLELCSLLKV